MLSLFKVTKPHSNRLVEALIAFLIGYIVLVSK